VSILPGGPQLVERAESPKPEWSGFSDAWHKGYQEIYAIRFSRGRVDPKSDARKSRSTLVRWLGLSYGPPVVAALALISAGDKGGNLGDRVSLLLLLGTINAGMFAAAVLAWGFALRRAATIDDLLRPCAARDRVVAVIHKGVMHTRQAALPLTLALVPPVLASSLGKPQSWSELAFVLLVANATLTMALLGNVSYWLIVPPIMVVRMHKCHEMMLRWNDPARTPGIRTFSEGYAYPALFLAMGALAVTVPGLLHHPLFGAYLPYLYGWLLALSLWVGVMTQLTIYRIVRRFRLRVLDELTSPDDFMLPEDQLPEIPVRIRSRADMSTTLSVYGSVAGAPGLPYGTALVVQYLAAVVGSVFGYLLQ